MNINLKKKNKGASILEAVIASALLALTALTFNKLHVVNFKLIHNSTQTLKTSMVLADFGEKVRLKSINLESADKTALIAKYTLWDYSMSKNVCSTVPVYVANCTSTSADLDLCSEDDMIGLNVYNTMCNIYNTTNIELIMNAAECVTLSDNLCIWVSLDAVTKTQAECEDDFNKCVLLEIRI